MKLGLIGKNISHSQSEQIYRKLIKSDFTYTLIDIRTEKSLPDLDSLFKEFDGISVTAPYKKSYFTQLSKPDDLNPLGIINTIKKSGNHYQGILTDLIAFREIFQSIPYNNLPIKILGDGSMGKMVANELTLNSLNYQIYSRRQGNLDQISNKPSFIINTCSRDYVFTKQLDSTSIFWDFNYEFEPHLKLGEQFTYIDGISLLEKQAIHALGFWQSK